MLRLDHLTLMQIVDEEVPRDILLRLKALLSRDIV